MVRNGEGTGSGRRIPDRSHDPWPVVRRRGNISVERVHGANAVAMVSRGVMGCRGRVRLLKSLALDARRLEKRKNGKNLLGRKVTAVESMDLHDREDFTETQQPELWHGWPTMTVNKVDREE
jgi:hypothetical protein